MQPIQSPQPADLFEGRCNCTAARRAARALTALYDKALLPAGVRSTQFSILNQIITVQPVTVGQLAAQMGMDRTTLTANLKPLARDGLVDFIVDQDRRKKQIRLTADGTRLYQLAVPLWQAAQTAFEDAYGGGRAAELRREFERVVATGRQLGVAFD
jgi:DNA-binding MarR family transcriptional regulator